MIVNVRFVPNALAVEDAAPMFSTFTPGQARSVILYHIVTDAAHPTTLFPALANYPTLNPNGTLQVFYNTSTQAFTIGNAATLSGTTDISCTAGLMQVIDRVVVPPGVIGDSPIPGTSPSPGELSSSLRWTLFSLLM